MRANFTRGIDPKDSMNVGAFRDLKWEDEYRTYPGRNFVSKDEALKNLIYPSLAPYIIKELPRQPEWTIDYQVKMLNYLFKNKSVLYSDILPLREIPKKTMSRIVSELEKRGVIKINRSKKPFTVSLGIFLFKESFHFERNLNPMVSMGIGKSSNPIRIESVEREYSKDGLIKSIDDVNKADQNTWMDPIDDEDEIDYLFKNWEKTIDPYYGFWYKDDEGDYAWSHPSELENEWVEYNGKKYFIPKTDKFKRIPDVIQEGVDFERGINPKSAMKIGKRSEIEKKRIESGWVDHSDLEWACYFGHTDYVKFLLNEGDDPNFKDTISLAWATWNGDPEIVSLLIKAGADPTARNFLDTPRKEYSEILNGMYGNPDPKKVNDLRKIIDILAHAIVKKNRGEELKENKIFTREGDPKKSLNLGTLNLIKKGMEEDSWATWTEENGMHDALSWAAFNGNADHVRFLLNMGADPSYDDYEPLMEAIREGNKDIVYIFIHNGLNLNNVKHHFIDNNDTTSARFIQNFISCFGLREGMDFERGRIPTRAMEIGNNRDNFFASELFNGPYKTRSFEELIKTAWGDPIDIEVLEIASKMLRVPKSKVLIACDEAGKPLSPHNGALDFFYFKRDWRGVRKETLRGVEIIQSNTVEIIQSNTKEIYVIDISEPLDNGEDRPLYMLGTIY